jgi:hypothetical protein
MNDTEATYALIGTYWAIMAISLFGQLLLFLWGRRILRDHGRQIEFLQANMAFVYGYLTSDASPRQVGFRPTATVAESQNPLHAPPSPV